MSEILVVVVMNGNKALLLILYAKHYSDHFYELIHLLTITKSKNEN